jgi:hypothetical protein
MQPRVFVRLLSFLGCASALTFAAPVNNFTIYQDPALSAADVAFNVPDDFLAYAQRAGYKYLMLSSNLYLASGPSDWTTDASGKKNGIYNWKTGTKNLYTNLKREFLKAHKRGLRLIPCFELGGQSGGNWEGTNDYYEWNVGVGVHKTPSFAPHAKGMDATFPSFLKVIDSAFKDAKKSDPTITYGIDYISIGHDEMYTNLVNTTDPMFLAATTSVIDQNFIKANAGTAKDYQSAYNKLYATSIVSRVKNVKARFPSAKAIVFGCMLDRQYIGRVKMHFWNPEGNNVPLLESRGIILEPSLLAIKNDLVIMPWAYSEYPLPDAPYDAEDAFNYFQENGYKFAPASAYVAPDYGQTIQQGRQMMHEYVRAASLPKYASSLVGFASANWIHDVTKAHWNTVPRPESFFVVPELAKAAGFYREKTDFTRLRESAGNLQLDLYLSKGDGYTYIGGTSNFGKVAALAHFPGNFNGGFCNTGISCDQREDLIHLYSDASSRMAASVYASAGSKFTKIDAGFNLGGVAQVMTLLPVDMNGDQKTDILKLWDNAGGMGWEVFTSNGSAYTGAWGPSSGSLGTYPAIAFLTGDYNRDGMTDLFQVYQNGSRIGLQIYTSTGSAYETSVRADISGNPALKYLTGDIDGDGRTDIINLWNNSGRLGVQVYHSPSIGIAYFTNSNIGGSGAMEFLTGDIDGDGKTDIFQLWNNSGTLAVEVYRSTGTGFVLNSPNSVNLGNASAIKYMVSDMNGDGKSDIVKLVDNQGNLAIETYVSDGAKFVSKSNQKTGMGTSASINAFTLNANDDR